MAELATEQRIPNPDEVYALLVEAHRGLSPEESQRLNAKLVLLLANHVGDPAVIAQAVRAARPAEAAPESGR